MTRHIKVAIEMNAPRWATVELLLRHIRAAAKNLGIEIQTAEATDADADLRAASREIAKFLGYETGLDKN